MKIRLAIGANIVKEGKITLPDIFAKDGMIHNIGTDLPDFKADSHIGGSGNFGFPGSIDDQVHFREPGLTQKADIYTESKSAVAVIAANI